MIDIPNDILANMKKLYIGQYVNMSYIKQLLGSKVSYEDILRALNELTQKKLLKKDVDKFGEPNWCIAMANFSIEPPVKPPADKKEEINRIASSLANSLTISFRNHCVKQKRTVPTYIKIDFEKEIKPRFQNLFLEKIALVKVG